MSCEERRFAILNETELNRIVDNKDSDKTKKATKYSLAIFGEYLNSKGLSKDVDTFNADYLNSRLTTFYSEIRNMKGEMYKLISFKSVRDGLARHFKKTMGVDIARDSAFSSSIEMFTSMCKATFASGKGNVDHKVPIATADTEKLYSSITFNSETPCGLLNKAWFELCLYFCRRGRENQRELKPSMFEVQFDADDKEYVFQKASEVTKNHRGIAHSDIDDKSARMYATNAVTCPVFSYKKYMSKRNPKCDAFFQTPRSRYNQEDDTWYENRPLGKNKLGSMMKDIAKAAKLSCVYTNHCIRATTITARSHVAFEARHIKIVSGHRSETSVQSYVRDTTVRQKQDISATLSTLMESKNQPKDEIMDDGMDDVSSLSLSQTEKILCDITNFEANNFNEQHRQIIPMSSGVSDAPSSEHQTLLQSNANYQIQNVNPTPSFVFHGCNVQIHNYNNNRTNYLCDSVIKRIASVRLVEQVIDI